MDFVAGWIIKDEFREFLNRRFDLTFPSDSEFNKFWKRVDLDGFNAIRTDAACKRIAGPVRPFSSPNLKEKSSRGSVTKTDPIGDVLEGTILNYFLILYTVVTPGLLRPELLHFAIFCQNFETIRLKTNGNSAGLSHFFVTVRELFL